MQEALQRQDLVLDGANHGLDKLLPARQVPAARRVKFFSQVGLDELVLSGGQHPCGVNHHELFREPAGARETTEPTREDFLGARKVAVSHVNLQRHEGQSGLFAEAGRLRFLGQHFSLGFFQTRHRQVDGSVQQTEGSREVPKDVDSQRPDQGSALRLVQGDPVGRIERVGQGQESGDQRQLRSALKVALRHHGQQEDVALRDRQECDSAPQRPAFVFRLLKEFGLVRQFQPALFVPTGLGAHLFTPFLLELTERRKQRAPRLYEVCRFGRSDPQHRRQGVDQKRTRAVSGQSLVLDRVEFDQLLFQVLQTGLFVEFCHSQAVYFFLNDRTLFGLFPKDANAAGKILSISRVLIEASNLSVDGRQQSLEHAGPTFLGQRVETALPANENHQIVALQEYSHLRLEDHGHLGTTHRRQLLRHLGTVGPGLGQSQSTLFAKSLGRRLVRVVFHPFDPLLDWAEEASLGGRLKGSRVGGLGRRRPTFGLLVSQLDEVQRLLHVECHLGALVVL